MKKFTVGKVRDAHGMKGELFIVLFAGKADWLTNVKTLDFKGQSPSAKGKHSQIERTLTVKTFREHKKGIIVKFEELSDRTAAEAMIGFSLELPPEVLKSEKGETIFLAEIEGFELWDNETLCGKICSFGTNGAQDLLEIEAESGVFSVPLVPELLLRIDWDQQKVVMDLPEGMVPQK